MSKLSVGERVRHNGIVCQITNVHTDGTYNIRPMVGNWMKQFVALGQLEALDAQPTEPVETKQIIALTPGEQTQLEAYEVVIEAGLKVFYEVGSALAEIRDHRLYRATYRTFEEYCDARWGMSRPRAYQLIGAAEVTKNLSTIVDIPPQNEAQARPLTPLSPDQQREAWQAAVETSHNGKPTAAQVQQAVETLQAAPGKSMDVHYLSESSERYSPIDFMQSVRDVLGVIDLDPASHAMANRVVQARRYFDLQSDGLKQLWDADNVYLNPPYGTEITPWVARLISEYQRDAFAQAILLVPARTDTVWFGLLRVYPRCFITGRLKFWNDDDPSLKNSAPFPSAAFYLGHHDARFAEVFSAVGDVYQLWINR